MNLLLLLLAAIPAASAARYGLPLFPDAPEGSAADAGLKVTPPATVRGQGEAILEAVANLVAGAGAESPAEDAKVRLLRGAHAAEDNAAEQKVTVTASAVAREPAPCDLSKACYKCGEDLYHSHGKNACAQYVESKPQKRQHSVAAFCAETWCSIAEMACVEQALCALRDEPSEDFRVYDDDGIFNYQRINIDDDDSPNPLKEEFYAYFHPELKPGVCEDTCSWSRNHECDDERVGGPCRLGTDCSDCGPIGVAQSNKRWDSRGTAEGWWDDDDFPTTVRDLEGVAWVAEGYGRGKPSDRPNARAPRATGKVAKAGEPDPFGNERLVKFADGKIYFPGKGGNGFLVGASTALPLKAGDLFISVDSMENLRIEFDSENWAEIIYKKTSWEKYKKKMKKMKKSSDKRALKTAGKSTAAVRGL